MKGKNGKMKLSSRGEKLALKRSRIVAGAKNKLTMLEEVIQPYIHDKHMKEILPKELSKYFFFDGERIGNMSKEIRKGKSAEFAQAVRSLLGLSAFQSALDHLGGRNSVIKMYNESYDTKSDSKIAQYTKEIEEYEEKLRAIEERLAAIDGEEAIATDKKAELEEEIRLNKDSEILAKERDELVRKIKELVAKKASSEDSLLKVFNNNAHSYFAKKMMSDALSQLAAADKIDTGIPYIHAKTIEFLIKRKKCICGADIEFGNEAYKELNDLLEFIPPQSIGTSIGQFVRECELRCKSSDTLFEDISTKFGLLDFIGFHLIENLMSAFVGKREAPLSAELLYLPLTDEALVEQHLITSEWECQPDALFLNDVFCIRISGQAADASIGGQAGERHLQAEIVSCELINRCGTSHTDFLGLHAEEELVKVFRDGCCNFFDLLLG